MPHKENRLYWRAWAGSGVGFVTFGWDAGVLGGILLTPSFQLAMHVRIPSQNLPPGQYAKIYLVTESLCYYRLHDHLCFLTRFMARLYTYVNVRNVIRPKNFDNVRKRN